MSLYDTYAQYVKNKKTEEETAEAFGLSLKDFRYRLTRYGDRLPQVLSTLDRIATDEITRTDAAAILGVKERSINALQKSWAVNRPIKEYKVRAAVSQVKWEVAKKVACEFIAGTTTIEKASELSGLSTRQMRRWVTKLIVKHFGITFKDLADMTLSKRGRMADHIENAEGLEAAKQKVLGQVVLGQKALEDVAVERLQSMHSLKGRARVIR
jgi:hypothetical protein